MIIDIHDVGHGSCAVIAAPNGKRIMVDCGYGSDPYWFPSVAYCGQRIDLMFFGNLDEDHLDDLPYVWGNCPIGTIVTNPTVNAAALAEMKAKGGMREGVEHALAILKQYGAGRTGPIIDAGPVSAWAYYNSYFWDFTDTNNLSLAVFVRYGRFTILFGGDLETAGWRALMRNPNFVRDLGTVTVFVASHHGRESGKCADLFKQCRPEVFVFSDGEIQYETQETADWYATKATGIPIIDAVPDPIWGPPRRKVMTTRRDGSLKILVTPAGTYRVLSNPRPALPASGLAALSVIRQLEHRE